MLNQHLLKEGRPSRPNRLLVFGGFLSLLLILLSTGFYFVALFVKDVGNLVNDFRVIIVSAGTTYDFSGMEFVKMMMCIPLSTLGALIGGINLIRITNRKPFLSILHVIPAIGFIAELIGFPLYYFLLTPISKIPFEWAGQIPYMVFVYGCLAFAAGIAFADLFALFYNHLHSYEFKPIYKAYRKAKKNATTNSERARIRRNFKRYWKRRQYDELLALLLSSNINAEGYVNLELDSYEFLKNSALKNISKEKAAQLDELYETGQHALLKKELDVMLGNAAYPTAYTPETIHKEAVSKVKEELPVEPATIQIDDGEESLTRYGKSQIKKGRKKAMKMAAKAQRRSSGAY